MPYGAAYHQTEGNQCGKRRNENCRIIETDIDVVYVKELAALLGSAMLITMAFYSLFRPRLAVWGALVASV